MPIENGKCQRFSYVLRQGEFAQTMAAMAATIRTMPLAASIARNRSTGASIDLTPRRADSQEPGGSLSLGFVE